MIQGSPYIEWSKSTGRIRFNLAYSGVRACPRERLDPRPEDLEISGPNGDGWPRLIEKLAHRHQLQTSQIALAHGASMANHLVCATLLQPGDHVLVEEPGFDPLRLVPQLLGAEVEAFRRRKENGFAVDPGEIEGRITDRTRLLIFSNLHNPTGAFTSGETLAELAALAERHGFHILVDEVYLEFLEDWRVRTAAHWSPRFVATRSLTKAYGLDGLRAGWIMGSPETIGRILRMNNLFTITTAHPTERLAARALDRIPEVFEPVAMEVARNRVILESFLKDRPELEWSTPAACPVSWIGLRDGSVDRLVERLETRFDTTVAPGRFFGDPTRFRLGFGMSTDLLRGGLERLGAALDETEHRAPSRGSVGSIRN